jgi:aminoglycoside phosphotransferase (APT) family kinase protein
MSDTKLTPSPILELLRADGCLHSQNAHAVPLTGGVSSDVFLVEDGERRFVVKQALPKLKVEDMWKADVSRNRTEYEYLDYVGRILPEAVPKVFAAGDGYFTMEYLGEGFVNWKQMLLAGQCRPEHAAQAGKTLGVIHRMSAGQPEAARIFDTTETFHQLRTNPYLVTAGQRHPELREYFEREIIRLESTRECVVHGDYSPKNILIGNGRQVILDCEVAWYGDPAFDLAFLLNHLLLKGLYHAPKEVGLGKMVEEAMRAYNLERRLPENKQNEFDRRTARLLPLLLLARIDGKSPVEYLRSEKKKNFVREFVTALLPVTEIGLAELSGRWFAALQKQIKKQRVNHESS